MQNSKKYVLDMKWSQTFCEVNIHISIVRHSMFTKVGKATNEVRILYKPLAYHAMCKSFLDDGWYNIPKLTGLETKSIIYKYGYTICLDKWKNVVRRPLMNVI